MRIAIALLAAAFVWGSAFAAADAPSPFKAETKQDFDAAATGVRKEMDQGGRYAYVTRDERRKVETALGEMGRIFDTHATIDDMNRDVRIKMFNQQEIVNSILLSRDRDRVICEHTRVTGTHMTTTSCSTYGEIEERRASGRKMIEDLLPSDCGKCAAK